MKIWNKNVSTKKKLAFTLVELIIVITILAILWTIWFISFQSYTLDARDTNRITSIGEIKKWLDIYTMKNSKYPLPDWTIATGTINWQDLAYVWEIWKTISDSIRLTSLPIDPLTKTSYTYGISSDKKYYQIATIIENSTTLNPIIENTYANSELAKVYWNYPWILKFNSGSEQYIANVPSLIFNNNWFADLLSPSTYFVVDKKLNLPYNKNWIKDLSIQKLDWNKLIQEITGTWNASLTRVNITWINKDNFSTYFNWEILASFNIKWIDSSNNDKIIENLKGWVLWNTSVVKDNNTWNDDVISCNEEYEENIWWVCRSVAQVLTVPFWTWTTQVKFTIWSWAYFNWDIINFPVTWLPKWVTMPLWDFYYSIWWLSNWWTFTVSQIIDKNLVSYYKINISTNKWTNVAKTVTFIEDNKVKIDFDLTDGWVYDTDWFADGIFNNGSARAWTYLNWLDSYWIPSIIYCPTWTYNPNFWATSVNSCASITTPWKMPINSVWTYVALWAVWEWDCTAWYYCSNWVRTICTTWTTSAAWSSLSSQCY